MLVNGHGGNAAVGNVALDMMAEYANLKIKFHAWYAAPKTMRAAKKIRGDPSHANWFENFPWTRLGDVAMPQGKKPMVDLTALRLASPEGARQLLGDGNFGGPYQIEDTHMQALWKVAVSETRELLEGPW